MKQEQKLTLVPRSLLLKTARKRLLRRLAMIKCLDVWTNYLKSTTIKTNMAMFVSMENSEENVYNISIISTFQQRVDFVLIDQDNEIGARQNKVWRLSCDRDSDYFKRPNKMKSLGFGCPKFVSLETLKTRNRHSRDNTILIRTDVEPLDISWLLFLAQKIRYACLENWTFCSWSPQWGMWLATRVF